MDPSCVAELDPKPEDDGDLLEEMPARSQPSAAPPAVTAAAGRIRSKTCDVRGCTSNSLRNPEVLFVAVPGQNVPERRFVWLTLMQAVRDKKRSYVCSRHFAVPEDFKDFHEYISAPPGYKRQLLVKRGVVPHFNMPPLNIPGLPPLNDHWQLTLPVGMTQTDQIRQARVTEMFGGHLQGPPETSARSRPAVAAANQKTTSAVQCAAKAVQTETVFSGGQRKMQPSLQYCRLCLQRQDLEPIFTGDQTLIEPDLIDKIYGCTQILITVENDFPSSICSNCYQNVQHFITFRRSVQKNDQSLRSTAATTFKPVPCPPLPAPTRSSPATTTAVPPVRTKTIGKVTPMRPVPSTATPAPVRASLASPQCPGIVPLAPWSMPKPQTVQQQQPPPPQQRSRVYAPQRTIYRKLPIDQTKDAPGNASDTDPFANVEVSSAPGWDNQQEGVQMGDRVVPVTLIRVQPEQEEEEVEEEEEDDVMEVPNEPEQKQPEEDNSRRNFLQPKPLEKLLENARKSATETEPEVLQAVELIPSAVAQEVEKQRKVPKIFLRKAPVPTKRHSPVATLSKVKETPKFSPSSKVIRAVKFPGTLTTLFSGVRKASNPTKSTASPELTKYKAVISPKPAQCPEPEPPAAQEKQISAPPPKPKPSTPTAQVLKEVKLPEETPKERPKLLPSTKPKQKENAQVLKEVKLPEESPSESPRPKLLPSTKPKQKENDIPESPQSVTSTDVTSPRTARARKIPAKFQDTVGFPMPKIVIKTDPDGPAQEEKTPRAKLPEVKSASELPQLRVRVQDARARLSGGKPDVSPASKTRLSSGSAKEPEKKTQPAKVKEVEKKPVTPVSKPKETTKTPVAAKEPEKKTQPAKVTPVSKLPVKTQMAAKELEKKAQPAKTKEAEKKPVTPISKTKEAVKSTAKSKEAIPPSKSKQTVKVSDTRGRQSKEPPPEESSSARPTKRKSIPDEKESPRAKRVSVETASPKGSKPNGSRKSAPPAKATPPPPAPAPRASACPFCKDRTFDEKKALVKHLRKRHGMDYATVRQRLAIYGLNW